MSTQYRIASGRASLAAEVVGSGDPVIFLHARSSRHSRTKPSCCDYRVERVVP
jgi:hypothetical protein